MVAVVLGVAAVALVRGTIHDGKHCCGVSAAWDHRWERRRLERLDGKSDGSSMVLILENFSGI